MAITSKDIKNFCENLATVTSCINSTLACAPYFEEAVQHCEGLQCVHVRNFVGIGAVKYMPAFLRGQDLAPAVSQQIDDLNRTLAERLSELDPLYSVGQTTEGAICICLGVVRAAVIQFYI